MNCSVPRWRTTMRLLALALVVATVPWPVLAGEGKQPAAKPGLQASIKPAVHAVVNAAKPASRQSAQQQQAPADKSALESKSFFKTTTGLIVLAVVGAGVGVTFYSISHDRIQPTGR